ncbi:MAG: hypothetical protein QM796_12875 [Chthoniobacteraceae bacterium]
MRLSTCSTLPPLLFGAVLGLLSVALSHADDQIVLKDGRTQTTRIMGTTATSVLVQVGSGTAGIPLASITSVTMTPPADFTTGLQAYASKDYPTAVSTLTAITGKYKGLPAPWVQQGMTTIGDAYLAMNNFTAAQTAYAALKAAYPGKADLLVNVGLARIDFARKDYDAARQKLQPIADAALKQKMAPKEYATAYSQTFCLLGQIEETAGNNSAALEDYLRTVTLYYKDDVAVTTAQSHADALKAKNVVVP